MHQDGFVVVRAKFARAAFDDAEVGQHLAHVVQFALAAGGRVAGEFRALDHDEIGVALPRQFPGAGQAGHAGAQDGDAVPVAG
ncbi:hypothetical protein G6F64_015510 [Rhizopus arrhizus]|uniref:Uncharacterized protein n=1 Tax=Rhizopus oryzae TaxID=64495 RepID=A0A9P6WR87_RHIOR|nr:hypothetical protein G6F64_015510 [Rhizopus arrhizus]